MLTVAISLLFYLGTSAHAGTSRPTEADSLISTNGLKTWSLPSASDTVVGRASTDTLMNKTISGASNTLQQLPVGADSVQETPSGTVNGSNVTFTLANTPAASSPVLVFLDGILQLLGGGEDYTISGTTITFVTAPVAGQNVRVQYFKY